MTPEKIAVGVYLLIALAFLIFSTREWFKDREDGDEPPNLFMMSLMWGPILAFIVVFVTLDELRYRLGRRKKTTG